MAAINSISTSDNIITNGQTGVVIAGSGFEAAQGTGTVTIDGVTQTVTAWSDTAITITHVRGSMKYGAQTLSVTNDSAEVTTHNITVNPATGYSYVNLSGYVEETSDITGTPSLTDGDQLEYDNIAGAFSVSISPLGLVTLTGTGSPVGVSFGVIAWDASNTSWGSTSATYTSSVQNSKINQLPAANYTPAKFTMEAVSPRPDGESDPSGGAYYRYYHASMAYRARVAVRGGAWPLHYDLTTAPAGATIGNNYGDADYGVISWESPTGASETFTVTVTDQERATLVVTWTATLDESKFVFVNADAEVPGTGTFAEPLSDIDNILSGHANKIAVLRGSASQYAPTTNLVVGNTIYPSTLMGFPGESPIVDGAGGRVSVNDDDTSVINIIFDGSKSPITGPNHAIFRNAGDRFLLWNCTFRNQDVGAGNVGFGNPACFVTPDIGPNNHHTYIAVVDCTQEASSMTAFAVLFTTESVLIENNFLGDSDLSAIPVGGADIKIHVKDDSSKFSVRANNIIAPSHNGTVISISQQGNTVDTTDQEVCWNTIVAGSTNETYNSGLIVWGRATSSYQTVPNMYQYRNSITNKYEASNTKAHIGSYRCGNQEGKTLYPVTIEDELWSNGGYDTITVDDGSTADSSYDGTSDVTSGEQRFVFGAVKPLIVGLSDVDANGLLTGAKRTTYLGTVGAEVEPVTAPTSVTATAVSMDQINISWTPVAGAGLSIERSLNDTSSWEEVYFCPSDDGDGQGNPIVKLFSHLPNKQYFYRLRHCVSSGELASYSEYSYVVNATTADANNIYYVAPSGGSDSNNNGLASSPFATVQHAINITVPGDIIRLQAGTHTAASNFFAELYHGPAGTASEVYSIAEFAKSGTEALPYILEADPGATVVLDCQAGAFRTGGLVGNIGVRIRSGDGRNTQSHIHIKNIEMRDVRGNGVHFPDNNPAHDTLTVGDWAEGIVLENLTVNRLWGTNFLQKYVRADIDLSFAAQDPPEYKSHRDDTYPSNWYDDISNALIRWNFVGVNNAAYRVDNTRNSIFRNIKANDCYWNDQDNTDPIGRANHVAGIHWYGAWNNLVENCVFKDIGSVGIFQKAGEDNTPASGWSVVARYNIVDTAYTATTFQLANVGEDHRFKLYNNILKNYYAGVTTGKNANLDQVIVRNNVFDADGSFWGYGTVETAFGITGPNDGDGVQESVDTVITGNIFNGHNVTLVIKSTNCYRYGYRLQHIRHRW